MKNKKLLYVLIPATLLLWGMIVYKIVGVVKGTNNDLTPIASMISDAATETMNDTFSIHPDYRDPFSGKSIKKIVSISPTINSAKTKPIVQLAVVPWPSVIYSGMIKNQKSNKQLALVQINGLSNIMTIGEKMNDVELVEIFRDSIEVHFGKEKKIIKK